MYDFCGADYILLRYDLQYTTIGIIYSIMVVIFCFSAKHHMNSEDPFLRFLFLCKVLQNIGFVDFSLWFWP